MYEKLTLKQIRMQRGHSRAWLAVETGLSERTIQNYEDSIDNLRKASIDNIEKIASALNVRVDEICLSSTSIK